MTSKARKLRSNTKRDLSGPFLLDRLGSPWPTVTDAANSWDTLARSAFPFWQGASFQFHEEAKT
jgi:hypothetical protein